MFQKRRLFHVESICIFQWRGISTTRSKRSKYWSFLFRRRHWVSIRHFVLFIVKSKNWSLHIILVMNNHFLLFFTVHVLEKVLKSFLFWNGKKLILNFGNLRNYFVTIILCYLKLKLGTYFVHIIQQFRTYLSAMFYRLRCTNELKHSVLKILSEMQCEINFTRIYKSRIVLLLKFLNYFSSGTM